MTRQFYPCVLVPRVYDGDGVEIGRLDSTTKPEIVVATPVPGLYRFQTGAVGCGNTIFLRGMPPLLWKDLRWTLVPE